MKVLIADAQPFFREGFRQALTDLQADMNIAEADSCETVMQAITEDGLQIVFLDIQMEGANGFECIQKVTQTSPDLRIIIVSALEEPRDIQEAFHHGAAGYLPKTLKGDVMINALRLILAGGTYLPPAALKDGGKTSASFNNCIPNTLAETLEKLTPRQRDVFSRLGQGKSNREIADELGLSVSTIKIYVTGVLKALQISNRTQAGILASKNEA